jgi:NTP pyrophosphatase (non-canonical NTP hydrolase)
MRVVTDLKLENIKFPDDIDLVKKHRPSDERSERLKCYLCMSMIPHKDFIYELGSKLVHNKRWYVHKTCWERYKILKGKSNSENKLQIMTDFDINKLVNLDTLQSYIHDVAIRKGWWKESRSPLEIHSLIHSEVSEATEAVRIGNISKYYNGDKPEGEFVELADTMIRILDYAEANQVSMIDMIIEKMRYNENRPFRHGGKKY